jgi:hypothetical protein
MLGGDAERDHGTDRSVDVGGLARRDPKQAHTRPLGLAPHGHAPEALEVLMSGKNKGGREDRKPKQEQNKKHKGFVVPTTTATLDAVNHPDQRPKK